MGNILRSFEYEHPEMFTRGAMIKYSTTYQAKLTDGTPMLFNTDILAILYNNIR